MTEQISYLVIIGMGVTFLLALSLVFFYIRYQRRLVRQQLQLQKTELLHQAALLHATIQSQEDERKRIGRDLHDGVGGMLSNLKMNISRLNSATGNQVSVHALSEQCSRLIDRTITDVRAIAHSLSPPGLELFGLEGALEELSDDINRAGALTVSIESEDPGMLKDLDANVSLALYRVLQELLANTLKHAEASKVIIHIHEQDGTLQIDYKDDGKGFAQSLVNQPGMGMRNVESRLSMIGAGYNLYSSAGKGFTASISIGLPVKQNP